jgi:hypothetical protein
MEFSERTPQRLHSYGFAGDFRRSELVALNVEDLEEGDLGLKVAIRRSKIDQESAQR